MTESLIETPDQSKEKLEKSEEENRQIIHKYEEEELGPDDLNSVLELTVFQDRETKIPLFATATLTFTADEQMNAIIGGESSIGKTYDESEVLYFIPKESIIELTSASPRSFIHQTSAILIDARTKEPIDMNNKPKEGDPKPVWDTWYDLMRNSAYFIDLYQKILVFLDQPDHQLLKVLRSPMSHDRKISTYLITDKGKAGQNRTKTVMIQGPFTVIFASAYNQLDDQDSTRNLLLSPSDDPEKIRKAIELQNRKKWDRDFNDWYRLEPSRFGLKNRMEKIKSAGIETILFEKVDLDELSKWFFEKIKNIAPRAMRDYPRLQRIAEFWAVFNFMHRKREGNMIFATKTDVEHAKEIYEPIMKCNTVGLNPMEYNLWELLEPMVNVGLKISEIHELYYKVKQRSCDDKRLREILKKFCRGGLLREEKESQTIRYYTLKNENSKSSHSEIDNQGTLDKHIESPKNLQDKSQRIVDLFAIGGPLKIEDITKQLDGIIPSVEIPKILEQLMKEGTIMQPDSSSYMKV